MTIKTCAVALVLTLAPAFALAQDCNYGKTEQQSMSCAVGTTYDAGTRTCLPTSS